MDWAAERSAVRADYLANKVAMRRYVSEQISCTVWQDVAMADYVEQFEASELQSRQRAPA